MAFDFKGTSTSSEQKSSVHSNSSSGNSSMPYPSGSSMPKPSGFQNRPELNKNVGAFEASRPVVSSSNGYRTNNKVPRRPVQRRVSSPANRFWIPWNIVFPIIGIILAIVLCWVFRDEITAFLSQVLGWIITILIIIFLIKYFIFPRRR